MLCARGRGGYLCNSIVSHKTVSGHHYHSNRRGRIFTTWKRRSETALSPPVPSRPSSFRLPPPARGSRSSFMSTNPPPQIVIPVSRRAKRRLFNKESLRRLFLFFFFQILILSLFISGKIFHVSVFFHSEFNFRPSVGCLAAGHRHQTKARFMQMAEEEFLRDRSRSVCTSLYLAPNRHISFHFLLRCLQ